MSEYGFGAVPNELLDRKDARIAKLEAELEHKCDDCLPKYGAYQERAEQAEAEPAALGARRCETCEHYHPYPHNQAWGTCSEGVTDNADQDVYHSFYCNRWAERSTP